MPTKSFLYSILLYLCIHPLYAQAAEQPLRPNILLMIADDQTWRDIGCYGNNEVLTPNIDKLATEGMRFTRCFTATAMCAPTRQQLYTGIYPVRNGAYPNHSVVNSGTKSIVHFLRDLGYRVGLAGKQHFGPVDSFPFEIIELDAVGEFIGRDTDQPFFFIYASKNPHAPWDNGPQKLFDPTKLTIPPYMVDTPEIRTALSKYYAEITALDDEVGMCLEQLKIHNLQDNTIALFTSEQGSQFPFAKWTCYDLGLRTALIARWPGHIKSGSTSDAMVEYVDMVPTLLEAIGSTAPDGLDGRSFYSVLEGKTDTHKSVVYGIHTTLGIKKGTPNYPVRSIRNERYKYILNLEHASKFQNIITETDKENYWNSIVQAAKSSPKAAQHIKQFQHRPAEEFYDVKNDPFELHNLAHKPEHRKRMDEMHVQLKAWMKSQGDLGSITELDALNHQRKKKRTPK